jgi:hypothetical protein
LLVGVSYVTTAAGSASAKDQTLAEFVLQLMLLPQPACCLFCSL